jgi:CRISPR/Cas system-associated exonuclease Cas4 (RecB family)
VQYKDGWLKLILDVFIAADSITIIDFKTGKREYNDVKHTQQMQLYACVVGSIYPASNVKTELWYLTEGHNKTAVYTPEKLAILRPKFHARAERMLNDEHLTPKPSKSNCRWCNHKDKCEYTFEP